MTIALCIFAFVAPSMVGFLAVKGANRLLLQLFNRCRNSLGLRKTPLVLQLMALAFVISNSVAVPTFLTVYGLIKAGVDINAAAPVAAAAAIGFFPGIVVTFLLLLDRTMLDESGDVILKV